MVRADRAVIVCDMRGCSDRATAQAAAAPEAPVRSRLKSRYQARRAAHAGGAVVTCDVRGCSDGVAAGRAEAPRNVDANGNIAIAIVGGRPAGCPRAYCGCEASRYLFGRIRPELNLAANWIKRFPRTSPAPDMVAARNHHVMVLLSHAGGNDWLVHDGNSGGGLTRDHVISISRYVVVNPHGLRTAAR